MGQALLPCSHADTQGKPAATQHVPMHKGRDRHADRVTCDRRVHTLRFGRIPTKQTLQLVHQPSLGPKNNHRGTKKGIHTQSGWGASLLAGLLFYAGTAGRATRQALQPKRHRTGTPSEVGVR
jgi:hypothetical protein